MKKLKEMTIGNVQPKMPGHLDDAVVASDIAKLRGVYGDDVEGAVVEFIEFYENCIDYDVPVRELLEYAAKGFNITIDEVKRIWHDEYPEDHSLDIDEKKVNNLGESIMKSMNEAYADRGVTPFDKKIIDWIENTKEESNQSIEGILMAASKIFKVRLTKIRMIWQRIHPETFELFNESIMNNGYETMEWNLDINGESDVPVKIEWKTQPAEPDVGVMQSYIDEYFVTVLATGEDVTDLFPKDQIEDIIETFGYDDDREDESDDERIPYDDMLGEGTKKPQSMKDALIKALDKPEKKLSKQEEENRKEENQKRWAKNPHNPVNKKELGESKMSPIFENGKLVTTFAQFIGETELVKKYPIKESDDSIGCCNDGGAKDCYSVQDRQAIYNAYKSVEDNFNWDGEDFVTLPGIDCDILPQHMMEIVDEFEGNYVNESKNSEIASLVESVAKIMRR